MKKHKQIKDRFYYQIYTNLIYRLSDQLYGTHFPNPYYNMGNELYMQVLNNIKSVRSLK